MRIAGHTMGTPELTLEEAVRLFARIGLDGIEIIWDDDYRCALPKRAPAEAAASLARLVADNGLAVACLTPYMVDIGSADDAVRQRDLDDFSRCIDAAARLGAPCIRVYGGAYLAASESTERGGKEDRAVASLRALGDRAAPAGVTLAVETHFNTLTCTAEETARIVRRVDHPRVRVLYDQPNLEFSEGEPYDMALRLLEGLVAMVHVKDLVFKEGAAKRFTADKVVKVDESVRRVRSRIPGEGIVPWPKILSALAAQGFAGWLSLEYERRWHPDDLPPAEDGMRRGAEYVRSLMKSL